MRRAWAILLLLAFASLGSGALRYVHELAHAAEHAHAAGTHAEAGSESHPAPDHDPLGDPEDCFTHAQLKLPMLQDGHVPRLACLGLTEVLPGSQPVATFRSRQPVLELNSRAPPAC